MSSRTDVVRCHPLWRTRAQREEPSLVHQHARPIHPRVASRPRTARRPGPHRPDHRDTAVCRRHGTDVSRSSRGAFRASAISPLAHHVPPRSRRHRRGGRRPASRAGRPRRFASRPAAPTSGFRFRRPTSSVPSAGACRRRPDGRSNLSKPELVIRVEVLTNDAFFFFDREAGRRRAARRHGRQGHGAPFGRHRFAGRGLASHPARLPRRVRPLSQRADSLAHVAGQSARRSCAS